MSKFSNDADDDDADVTRALTISSTFSSKTAELKSDLNTGVLKPDFNNNKYGIICIMLSAKSWPRGYKTFFMLNSAEHEILNTHKYENIKQELR